MNALLDYAAGDPTIVYALLSFSLIFAVSVVIWLIKAEADSPARQTRRRARMVNDRYRPGKNGEMQAAVSVKRKGSDSSFAILDRIVKTFLPRPALLRERLMKTGKAISVGEYVMICLLVGLVMTGLVHHFFKLGFAISLVTGMGSAIGLPHFTVGYLIARRINKFNSNFPEAIELIVRGLKSGLPVAESVKTVATEIPGPVGYEFAEVASNVKLGRTLDEAMWMAAKRIDTPEFRFFVISMSVQKETGGNLAETLANLADILRRRRQMKLKIKAMSSEARASAYILGSLPFIMFGIIYLMNRGYIMELFTDPRGHVMVGIGALMLLTGIGVMAKMVRFEI